MMDIIKGLDYLHGPTVNIIHGDVKGVSYIYRLLYRLAHFAFFTQVNILVSPSGRACLADFGLSTIANSNTKAGTQTSTRRAGGTIRWQAPELLREVPFGSTNYPALSKATDIYAFACVCYEVCPKLSSSAK